MSDKHIILPERTLSIMDYVEGENVEDKLVNLVQSDLIHRLQECEREIGQFEIKYRMTFAEFGAAWDKGEIPDRWSYPVEHDYMTWEGLEAEKRKWLTLLKATDERAYNDGQEAG